MPFFNTSSVSDSTEYFNNEPQLIDLSVLVETALSLKNYHFDWENNQDLKNVKWAKLCTAACLRFNGKVPIPDWQLSFDPYIAFMHYSDRKSCQVLISISLNNGKIEEPFYSFLKKNEFIIRQLEWITNHNKADFLYTLNQILRINHHLKNNNRNSCLSVQMYVNDQLSLKKEELFSDLPKLDNPFVIVLDFDAKANIVTEKLFGIKASNVQDLKKDLQKLPLTNVDVIYGVSEAKKQSNTEKLANFFWKQKPAYELKETKQMSMSFNLNLEPKPFVQDYDDIDIICGNQNSLSMSF